MLLNVKFFAIAVFLTVGIISPSASYCQKSGRWQGPDLEKKQKERVYQGKHPEESREGDEPEEEIVKQGMPAPKIEDVASGDGLVLQYITPRDKDYKGIARDLKDSRALADIVDVVNETFKFPHINVDFDLCGEDNAYYDSNNRRIIICYELVVALANAFQEDDELSDDEVGQKVNASILFTFIHELGHAAVDVFDLPITGNEEDAVDRFATLILLYGSDEEEDLADSALGSFDINVAESLDDVNFSDEHPVDEQRWYTMACLMFGSDPKKYGYLIGDDGLPEARAESCPAEFERVSKSWEAILASHMK